MYCEKATNGPSCVVEVLVLKMSLLIVDIVAKEGPVSQVVAGAMHSEGHIETANVPFAPVVIGYLTVM